MLSDLKGIGPKKLKLLNKLGIFDIEDLLDLFPIRYEDKRKVYNLSNSPKDINSVIKLNILKKNRSIRIRGKRTITKIIASDGINEIEIIYFNDIYTPNKINIGHEYYFYGLVSKEGLYYKLYNPEVFDISDKSLGIEPVYPLTKGLNQKEMRKFIKQALKYKFKDFISADILEKRDLLNLDDAHKKIHNPNDFNDINNAKKRLLYQETFILFLALNYLRQLRKITRDAPVNLLNHKVNKFIDSLEYKLTKDQNKVIEEISNDMKSNLPMNRLLQGDVGSGKTVVAMIAGIFSSENCNQTAFIAPTEVVAKQHYEKYNLELRKLNINSDILTGSTSSSEKERIKSELKNGEIDFIFGTHALLQDDIEFKKLGLVIADEQHKFGVKQRSSLISKGKNPHVLVMSATPIPRTLSLAIYGDLNISSIINKPSGRKEIQTYAVNKGYENRVFNFILKQIKESKQVYIVCPAIENNEELKLETVYDIEERIFKFNKNIKTEVLYSKLKQSEKDAIINDFKFNKISVLISTTVIEVGIDVPNANLMVIYNAERFGLSQLHQLRGRVGRGDIQSYCILICSSNSENARARMRIMQKTNDGYKIADKDLEMRGVGEVLGREQHGVSVLNIDRFVGYENLIEMANEDSKNLLSIDPDLTSENNEYLLKIIKNKISNVISSNSLN